MEDGRIEIEGISGTSAGAANAAVTAYGLAQNGAEGARATLKRFWSKISEAGRMSPLQATIIDKLFCPGNMDFSPFYRFYDNLSRVMSPYQLNPVNMNPLRDVLAEVLDCPTVNKTNAVNLFICATNVCNGKIKVFKNEEISYNAILASACLPFLFQAVEINGEHYWDGGYMGNPPLYPLIYGTETADVLIIQINPIKIDELPTSATAIFDRVNTLSFNSSLMREMRAIQFVSNLIDNNALDPARYKDLKIHTVDAEAEMGELGVSSKFNSDWEFLSYLFDLGRTRADAFLKAHFDKIGVESSVDIKEQFL